MNDTLIPFFQRFVYQLNHNGYTRGISKVFYILSNEQSYPLWLDLQREGLITIESSYVNIYNMTVTFTDIGYEFAKTFISFEGL